MKSLMPKKKTPASEFGARLYKIRKARGLTQIQLAKAIESNQRLISYYETDAEYPPTGVVVKLAKALNVSGDEILGLSPLSTAELQSQSVQEQRLWKKFKRLLRLPEKDQKAVTRLINSLFSLHE